MTNIGDKVIYKASGICTVEELCKQSIPDSGSREKSDCYLLRPLSDPAIKIYVPLSNEVLMAQIRPILTPEQMLALIEQVSDLGMDWIEEMRARTLAFRDVLGSGDRARLCAMIKLLYERRDALTKQGKKLYAADETALKKAEKLLFEEAAFVLEMSCEDISHLFLSKVLPQELTV